MNFKIKDRYCRGNTLNETDFLESLVTLRREKRKDVGQ